VLGEGVSAGEVLRATMRRAPVLLGAWLLVLAAVVLPIALAAGMIALGGAAAIAGGVLLQFRSGHAGRVAGFAVGIALLTSGWALEQVQWSQPSGERIAVALMQGNIRQDEKWLETSLVPTMQRYWSLTEEHPEVDLVVWPEAAIPALYHQLDRAYYAQVEDELLNTGQRLLTGTLVRDFDRQVYFNSAVVLGGEERRLYNKRHLVPFGEYFPVPDFVRRWLRLMNLPYSDFETGTDGSALEISPGLSVAVMICYEAVFGDELITALPDADFLVNISNDGWFGRSIGPQQHFQIARMRAIETQRWLLRATNTGITSIVDQHGRVHDRLPQFEMRVLRGDVQPLEGTTPYVRFGNWLVVLLAVVLLVPGLVMRFRAKP
ncbi:MAG: apolipoprotein N-acyltransferase, partial [Proteobacteria bacterium]|nr:apolipoprotein N-acyltransferase [Pseudomonadota bacterium]